MPRKETVHGSSIRPTWKPAPGRATHRPNRRRQPACSEDMPIFSCTLAKFGVSFDAEKDDFIGKDALKKQLGTIKRVIKPFALVDKGIARDGAIVLCNDKEVGTVTSGTMAPYWKTENNKPTDENAMHAVGLALIDKDIKAGDTIDINLRGRNAKAIVGANVKNRTGKYCLAIEK